MARCYMLLGLSLAVTSLRGLLRAWKPAHQNREWSLIHRNYRGATDFRKSMSFRPSYRIQIPSLAYESRAFHSLHCSREFKCSKGQAKEKTIGLPKGHGDTLGP